jgi:hypothetical protein
VSWGKSLIVVWESAFVLPALYVPSCRVLPQNINFEQYCFSYVHIARLCPLFLKVLRKIDFRSLNHLCSKLTRCSRVLLEKLLVADLVKKFLSCHGTRRFIAIFTKIHHSILFCDIGIQSTPSHFFFQCLPAEIFALGFHFCIQSVFLKSSSAWIYV